MIARLWNGRTDASRAGEYIEYLRETGVTDLRNTPGNEGVIVLCDRSGATAKFTLISFWDSVDAIRQFAGADVLEARYYPRDPDFLHELEPRVQHLELVVDEWGR
ncbi:MAG: antibiotic biosynthesis monooxygenase [Thermoanaerobaculia bacterium]